MTPPPPPTSPGQRQRSGRKSAEKKERAAQSKAVILICPASEISPPHCFNCFNETLAYSGGILGINL